MVNMELNGTAFHDAPKNGGTTVRMWFKHHEGKLPDFSGRTDYYKLAGLGLPKRWHNNLLHEPRFFLPGRAGARHWCIRRDPIDRFISAYTDKVLHEHLVDWSVDTCLSMLMSGEMERVARGDTQHRLAACHFLPQTVWFGESPEYYNDVFDIGQMDMVKEFCEDVIFGSKLPALHARAQSRSGVEKVRLTPVQQALLEQAMVRDYRAGWG